MSYTPTTWKSGDTVTSEKLNKIEQGIVNASETANNEESFAFMVTYDSELGHTDKTVAQIRDALLNGQQVLFKFNISETGYTLGVLEKLDIHEYPSASFEGAYLIADSIDGYLFYAD